MHELSHATKIRSFFVETRCFASLQILKLLMLFYARSLSLSNNKDQDKIEIQIKTQGLPSEVLSFKTSIQSSFSANQFYAICPIKNINKIAYIKWLGYVKKERHLQLFDTTSIENEYNYIYQFLLKKAPNSGSIYQFYDVRFENTIDAYAGKDELTLYPERDQHQNWELKPSSPKIPGFTQIHSTISTNKGKSFDLFAGKIEDHSKILLYPTQTLATESSYLNQLFWLKPIDLKYIDTTNIYCIRPSQTFERERAFTIKTYPSEPFTPTYRISLDKHDGSFKNSLISFQFTKIIGHGNHIYRIDAKANFFGKNNEIIRLSLQHDKYSDDVELNDSIENPNKDSGQLWKIEFSYVSNFFYIISMKDKATNLRRDIQQFQRVRKHTLSTISRKR